MIGKRATITTAGAHSLRAGHKITIAGVYDMVPELRWWPRLRNWLLRRPAPTRRGGLTVFYVGEASGNTASISSVKSLHAGQ